MDHILTFPAGPIAEASLALARSSEDPAILDHSIRSFLYARLVAESEGCWNDAAYDEELLFAATVMHDLGLGQQAPQQARFEVEGADLAAGVLRSLHVPETDVDRVWEAIALHSSHGLAERRGLLTYLTYKGVFVDVGSLADAVAENLRQEVLRTYPKPVDLGYIADAIVRHAQSPAAAPPGSLAAFIMLQRQSAKVTP